MKPLATANEIAELLGVKPSWVYAEARANRIPHIRLGRYTRFDVDSIQVWASEREQGPVPSRPAPGREPTESLQDALSPGRRTHPERILGWPRG
jgi:excisionase family DNA binding protein